MMLKHLGSLGQSSLAFMIEDTHLTDGKGCSCGFIVKCSIPLCADNLSCPSLSLASNQRKKTSPDLESGKIKALSRYWHKLVQHLISSLNSSLKARGGIISLLIDEETEPQKAEMTYVASCKVVTEMGRDPWPLDPSFSLLIKTFHIKCKVL